MRNTYDTKNPYNKSTNNQQPKQRQTYTAVNPKMMSYQKQAPNKSAQTVQKMNRNILDALKRLSINNETKVLGLTSLKPAAKTLTGIIGMFLNSFDNAFDQSYLTVDVMPQLFKSLGYPNQINKTYFQPIGAPHTWNQCLMMMDWLAQLAIFHIDIRSHLQQGDFDEDFTSMLIRAHLQNNITIPKQHLEQSIARKGQKIQDLMYHTNTHALEIDNIKASQKDLNVMQDQKKRLQSILNRQTQEVIQVSQQNYQMQRRLKQLQSKIEEQKRMSQIHDNETTSLRQQIQSQQLSVEQVEKIRYQIRDFHQKITQIKRYYEQQKQHMDKIDNNIIEGYMQFNKTLEVVRSLYRRHKQNMQRRNVYMKIPQCEIGAFTQFVKARKQEWSELRTEQLLGVKEIKQIKEKAQMLIQTINKQARMSQKTRDQLHQQNLKLNEQCQQRGFRTNELRTQVQQSKKRIQSIKSKISQSQLINYQLTSQMQKIQQQIRLALSQQQQLIKQVDQLAREGMELGHLKLSLQNEVNQSINKMQERLNDYQFECLELLENDCEYFQQSAVEQGQAVIGLGQEQPMIQGMNSIDTGLPDNQIMGNMNGDNRRNSHAAITTPNKDRIFRPKFN